MFVLLLPFRYQRRYIGKASDWPLLAISCTHKRYQCAYRHLLSPFCLKPCFAYRRVQQEETVKQ
ncbi:hypothetical protein KCP73_22240 [Salmonella enterica subsp. enterica]|nr:hypothetical protein KCP73_22240 [Salmonella enterica subsp. enterica]